MHELGVQLYRQRMRREHPEASLTEINSLVRDWLTGPPAEGRLRLSPRGRGHGYVRLLAGRNQDLTDLEALIPTASVADLDTARSGAKLIQERGLNREQDVVGDLDKLIAAIRS